METPQNSVNQDPLGLKRFALTESAYDLVNSLTGVYSRLIFRENEKTNPDTDQLVVWRESIKRVQDLYYLHSWDDLTFLEKLITDLSIEYKSVAEVEAKPISQENHAIHLSPKAVSAN